jgi:hypothetical protein
MGRGLLILVLLVVLAVVFSFVVFVWNVGIPFPPNFISSLPLPGILTFLIGAVLSVVVGIVVLIVFVTVLGLIFELVDRIRGNVGPGEGTKLSTFGCLLGCFTVLAYGMFGYSVLVLIGTVLVNTLLSFIPHGEGTIAWGLGISGAVAFALDLFVVAPIYGLLEVMHYSQSA